MGNRLTNKRALGTVSAHGIGEPIATRAYAAKSTVAQTTEVNWEVMSGLDGVIHHDSVLEYSDFDREQSSDLNVKSMFLTIREVSPGVIALVSPLHVPPGQRDHRQQYMGRRCHHKPP